MDIRVRPFVCARRAATAFAACLVLLALPGCSLLPGMNPFNANDPVNGSAASPSGSSDAPNRGTGQSDGASEHGSDSLIDGLSDIDSSSVTRLVATDADSGEVLYETDDAKTVQEALAGFLGAWDLASDDDMRSAGQATYVVELWERETVKFGQSPDDVGEFRAGSLTVFADSDRIVTFKLFDGSFITLNLIARENDAALGLKRFAEGKL